MTKQDQLAEAMNAYQLSPDQRELLGSYIEGMVGIRNAYCLNSKDLQTLAGYVWDKSNR